MISFQKTGGLEESLILTGLQIGKIISKNKKRKSLGFCTDYRTVS